MELSRERKIFVGLFVTAVVALGVDQMLPGPSGASAGVVPPTLTGAVGAGSSEAGVAEPSGSIGKTLALFAHKLQVLDQGGSLDATLAGDAFAVPAAWLRTPEPGVEGQPASVSPPGPPRFMLSSVMPTKRGGIAVIDGKTYRQGDQVGAFTLELVEPRSVVMRRGDELYRVPMTRQP
ncbi:MAG: hypothetical protein ACIARR_02185 [Phycisphaerales bacterium JB059]